VLNFSKIKVILIYFFFLFFAFFSLLNLQDSNDSFLNKKVNLGLDLQGGSYLLLE
jgi:preprotein translocase subunit SecD